MWQRKVGVPPLQVRVAAALFAAGLVHRDHDRKGEEDEMESLERSDGRRGLWRVGEGWEVNSESEKGGSVE